MTKIIREIKNCVLTDEQTGIWYLGQEGFLFKHKGKYLLIDPYLSDFVDKNCCQFVTWKRLYPAPVKAEELDFIDVVLCTHTHYDHADPWTLPKIANASKQAVFVAPAPETATIEGYGIEKDRIIGAKADETLSLCGFKITPAPSAHEVFHKDEQGNYHELGYILDNGKGRFFHAGDMCMYDGLLPRLKNIDVGFLPINGRDYFRNENDIIGNFDSVEAVTLAKKAKIKMLVPVHHDLYEVNRVNPAYFVDVLMTLNPKQRYHIFAPAEKYVFMR